MQRQIYKLSRLLGINRNTATSAREWEEGVPTISPTEVKNLRPHPRGGLTPFGKLSEKSPSTTYPAVSSFTTLGYDQAGYSSFLNTFGGAGSLVVHDGTTARSADGTTMNATTGHIPSAGALEAYNNYGILDEGNTLRRVTALGALGSHTASIATTGAFLPEGIYSVMFIRYFKTPRGYRVINDFKIVDNLVQGGGADTGQLTYVLPVDAQANTYIEVYLRYLVLDTAPSATTVENEAWRLIKSESTATADGTFTIDRLPRDTSFVTQSGLLGEYLNAGSVNAYHNGRFYTANGVSTRGIINNQVDGDDMNLYYGEQGWINFADINHAFRIPATSSQKITALVSANSNEFGEYGGLMVFCENEIWLMTGEPAAGNVSFELYPVPIGCDEGIIPAVSGNRIFVIWRGELYSIDRGSYGSIGRSIAKPNESFTRVVIDNENSSIVATVGGANYRYFYEYNFWCNDLEVAVPVRPYPTPDSLQYADTTLGTTYVYEATNTGAAAPSVKYTRLDFDEQASADKLCDVRTFVREETISDGTLGVLTPQVKVKYRDSGNEATINSRRRGRGDYNFLVPHAAQERSREIDLEIILNGLKIGDVFETPLEIGWVRGYKSR